MGLLCTQRSKRSALVKKKGTESATNSCYGNKKQVMFLKLRPELYISLYICSLSSYPKLYYSWPRWHLQYERKTTGYKTEKTKKPGKRCVLMFCNKTNADGVSLNSFLKPWMLDKTSGVCLQLFHCNILQIFIFDHFHFLAKDVFFHTDTL